MSNVSSNYSNQNPERGMAIASLVLAVLLPPIGLVLALVARSRARKAGFEPDVLTTVALFVSIAAMIAFIVLAMALIVGLASLDVALLGS